VQSSSPAEVTYSSRWKSLNSFVSAITSKSDGKYSFLQQALAACATAFEEPHSTVELHYYLSIAANWIEQCGKLLVAGRWREHENDEEPELTRMPPRVNFPTGSLLGGTSDDFGQRRWNFWASRLRSIKDEEQNEVYASETKDLASRTLTKMQGLTRNE
jgi:hypothetical protein